MAEAVAVAPDLGTAAPDPPDSAEERLMAYFHRGNTTIFSDNEISLEDPAWFGVTVLLRFPPRLPPAADQDQINRLLIQQAINENCGVLVPEEYILRYDSDYLVWASSPEQATTIMLTPEIDIGGVRIVVYPWTPAHRGTIVPFDGLPPLTQTPAPARRPHEEVNEHLRVTVIGVPPHLLKRQTIPRIFQNICPYYNVHLNRENLTYTFSTYACRADIPRTWNLGIRRGTLLYMWPIWINVEGCAPPSQASRDRHDAAVSNMRVRFSLFPTHGAGPSGPAGGGGPAGGDGQQGALLQLGYTGGQQMPLLQLGYTVQSPDNSYGDSDSTMDTPPATPDSDPFDLPSSLSIAPSLSQVTQVEETPEGYLD